MIKMNNEKKKKGFLNDIFEKAGNLVGDATSKNSHQAVNSTIDGMSLFKQKAAQTANVDFSQAKGNLFEYIETAKFNREAALHGSNLSAYVTDSLGNPHATADILIKNSNHTVREVQAKVSETFKNGEKTSAADSVFYQSGGQKGHWGKYDGMQRLIRKDSNYNEKGSLLDESKKIATTRAESGGIHAKEYQDTYENLTDELNFDSISSGGTSIEELREAYDNPQKYASKMEYGQLVKDVKTTSINMAKTGAVSNGIISGVTNTFKVLRDEKELDEALKEVGKDMTRGAVRGGVTGTVSTGIRYGATKAGVDILADSTAATIMAAGIIDGGVALLAYAKGEISDEKLRKALADTTVKSVSTVYFTKAVTMVVGTANPFLPMAIYTAASYVVTSTREIIENAKLQAEEFERIRVIYNEATRLVEEYHQMIMQQLDQYEQRQRSAMESLLKTFDYNIKTGENYDEAIYAIISFSNQTGIALQYAGFDDFKSAMKSKTEFVFKR